MSPIAFIEERVLFSPNIPVEVNNLLQLDLEDRSGASVTMDLAAGVIE
jgi:hypothetical protein